MDGPNNQTADNRSNEELFGESKTTGPGVYVDVAIDTADRQTTLAGEKVNGVQDRPAMMETATQQHNANIMNSKPKVRRTVDQWLKKYFWEGQELTGSQRNAIANVDAKWPWWKRILVTQRRPIGLAIPALVYHFFWWAYFIKFNTWSLFQEKYFMSITMIFGSLIAGMTSEGGGAVAFPVMTLAFNIAPSIARDFSLLIQSCGMTAAAFTLFWMKVELEWNSIVFCTLGGLFGIVFGLEVLDPLISPPQKKIGFVCIWFSFAFALFLLNRYHKRPTFKRIPQFNAKKALILFITGIFGGIFTSIAGSGVDICSFSILTLLFRVTEKTATPTSVVLMAINTVIGGYWRAVMIQAVEQDTWEYLAVCIPVVVIGAPLGSILGTHFHRQLLAALVYILDTIALVSAFAIVPMSDGLIGVAIGIIVFGFAFFFALTKIGERLMTRILAEKNSDLKEVSEKQAGGAPYVISDHDNSNHSSDSVSSRL